MSHPYTEHIGGHWRGCYEEHLGCANERLEEARSHAGRLEECLRRLVAIADREPFCSIGHAIEHEVSNTRETLADYQKWEESQP